MNWPIAGIAVAALRRLAGARRDQHHRATSRLHQTRRHRAEKLRPERAAAARAGRDKTRTKIVGRRADDLDKVPFVNLQADQLASKSGRKRRGVQDARRACAEPSSPTTTGPTSAMAAAGGTVTTGHGASAASRPDTLPCSTWSSPARAAVPLKSSTARRSAAAESRVGATRPSKTSQVTSGANKS